MCTKPQATYRTSDPAGSTMVFRAERLENVMLARLLVLLIAVMLAPGVYGASIVTSGTGLAGATTARDSFRTALGGGAIAGANGSFGGVRREINWDGVPDASATPNDLPADFFNVVSPRGVVFSTPGSALQVSANAGATPVLFANINGTYGTTFVAFSAQRLFSPIGSNVVDVHFFVPGTGTAAAVAGFGAIFTDVDNANTTSIEYFAPNDASLGKFYVPAAGSDLSFLGTVFDAGEQIARVRITLGNTALGPSDAPPTADVVVMDDFLYSEPRGSEPQIVKIARPFPTLSNLGMLLLGTLLLCAGVAGVTSTRKQRQRIDRSSGMGSEL